MGLGNEMITPDALGPLTMRSIFVTRHLRRRLPEHFGDFRPVAALETGVLSTTGMETVETLSAVCGLLHPDLVIAVDALACGGVSASAAQYSLLIRAFLPAAAWATGRPL